MLSPAKNQWNELCHLEKSLFDQSIKDWVEGKTRPSIQWIAFNSGTLNFIEFETGLFLLLFARNNSLILVDFGKYDEVEH